MLRLTALPEAEAAKVLVRHGHRCAKCGAGCPLDEAQFISSADDGCSQTEACVCLCRQHTKWVLAPADDAAKSLVAMEFATFARTPWVQSAFRAGEGPGDLVKVELTLDAVSGVDESAEALIVSGVSAFLEISPSAVAIDSVQQVQRKTILDIRVPAAHADKLKQAQQRNDPALRRYLRPLIAAPFETIRGAECEQILQRRALFGPDPNKDQLVGLAFSGGGIRSATFGLGMLQGLAEGGWLKHFDYLSTVSGGGYIGSWLTAWIKREDAGITAANNAAPPAAGQGPTGLQNVQQQLKSDRTAQAQATRRLRDGVNDPGHVFDNEPEPIYHLRAYSNYLSPKVGLLSADTWTILSIYLRNVLLNQLLLLPLAILLVLVVPRSALWLFHWSGKIGEFDVIPYVYFGLAALVVIVFTALAYGVSELDSPRSSGSHRIQRGHLAFLVLLMLLSAVAAAWLFSADGADGRLRLPPVADWAIVPATFLALSIKSQFDWHDAGKLAVLFGLLHGVAHWILLLKRRRLAWDWKSLGLFVGQALCPVLSGSAGGFLRVLARFYVGEFLYAARLVCL